MTNIDMYEECHHLILSCFLGYGHVHPMMQLARQLTEDEVFTKEKFVVTLLLPVWDGRTEDLEISETARIKVVSFLVRGEGLTFAAENLLKDAEHLINDTLNNLVSPFPQPVAYIGDVYLPMSHKVAARFHLPFFNFLPCSLFCYLLVFRPDYAIESGGVIEIPGCGLLNTTEGYRFAKGFDGKMFQHILRETSQKSQALLINDVKEAYPSEVMRVCSVPSDPSAGWEPFCGGPLAPKDTRVSPEKMDAELEAWLNKQNDKSVLLVSLGTAFTFPPADIVEIARALKASGRPVVWAVRRCLNESDTTPTNRPAKEAVDEAGLPLDFIHDCDNIYIRPWVNLPLVLSHRSVGVFLTHCGWNSIIEGLTFGNGIPFLCLPGAAEQGINAWVISNLWNIGMRLNKSDNGHIERLSIQKCIDNIFNDSDIRERALRMHKTYSSVARTGINRDLVNYVEKIKASVPPRSCSTDVKKGGQLRRTQKRDCVTTVSDATDYHNRAMQGSESRLNLPEAESTKTVESR